MSAEMVRFAESATVSANESQEGASQGTLSSAVVAAGTRVKYEPMVSPAHSTLGAAVGATESQEGASQGPLSSAVVAAGTRVKYEPMVSPAHSTLGEALETEPD